MEIYGFLIQNYLLLFIREILLKMIDERQQIYSYFVSNLKRSSIYHFFKLLEIIHGLTPRKTFPAAASGH